MDKKDIATIICDFLQILKEEEVSKFVRFDTLILSYVLNITTDDAISEVLRVIINFYGKDWEI
jgi:hypothetical protein